MASKLLDFLTKARVFDEGQTVDLTAMSFAVCIGRIATAESLDWMTIAALALVLVSYNAKKWFASQRAAKEIADTEKLEKLEQEVRGIHSAINLTQLGR